MVGRDPYIAVYIMTNRLHGTLYIGVTSDLINRIIQHRDGAFEGFTKRHGLRRLVWYEQHQTIIGAIQREKSLKKYKREWKVNLIEQRNRHWDDLAAELFGEGPSPFPPLPSSPS